MRVLFKYKLAITVPVLYIFIFQFKIEFLETFKAKKHNCNVIKIGVISLCLAGRYE